MMMVVMRFRMIMVGDDDSISIGNGIAAVVQTSQSHALNLVEIFGTLLSWWTFDTFPSKNAECLGNYLSSLTFEYSCFQVSD